MPAGAPATRPAAINYPRPFFGGGLFNLADRSYIEWADARIAGLPENSAVRDRFTRPGRNVGLSVRLAY